VTSLVVYRTGLPAGRVTVSRGRHNVQRYALLMNSREIRTGELRLAIGGYLLRIVTDYVAEDRPDRAALLVDAIGVDGGEVGARSTFLGVEHVDGAKLLHLIGRDRYGFSQGLGACIVQETGRLFVGAGDEIRCYDLRARPPNVLWDDVADTGFWGWSRLGDVVLMSAELAFGAWSIRGEKLWQTFVEPPWSWIPVPEGIELDVMGQVTRFRAEAGPSAV
jgi:hypothetical protein